MNRTYWLGVVALSAASVAMLGSPAAFGQRFGGGGNTNNNNSNDDNKDNKKDKDKDKNNKGNQGNNNQSSNNQTSNSQGNQNNKGNQGGNSSNSGNSNKSGNSNSPSKTQPFFPNKDSKDNKDTKDIKDRDKNDGDKNNKDRDKNDWDKDKNDRDKKDVRDWKRDHDDHDGNPNNNFSGQLQPKYQVTPGKAGVVINNPGNNDSANKKFGFWKGDEWQGSRKMDNWSRVYGTSKQPFSADWYHDHPRAWRYDNNRSNIWMVATVPGVYSWLGWGRVPPQYMVGFDNSTPRFDPSQFGDYYPLGLYSLMTGPDDVGTRVLQLAVDRRGRINGNYFDMITDSDHGVSGIVQQQTQYAEWTLDQNPNIRFRSNIARLLQPSGNVTVQLPGGEQRWQFVRLEN